MKPEVRIFFRYSFKENRWKMMNGKVALIKGPVSVNTASK